MRSRLAQRLENSSSSAYSNSAPFLGRHPAIWLGLILALLVTAHPASAITITLVYNAGASVEPAADPTGALLTDLFQHADSQYTDIFEDVHALTINFWWEDLDPISTGTLGVHGLVTQAGGRETEANIRIDNDRTWFLDPTPTSDSEFDMAQTLWRDLSGAQQSDFYNNFGASIPETFEVGYTGSAVAGGAAVGAFDALSVIMHEVGHALGMSASNNSTIAQTADNDYDFNSDFVFGQALAAEVADGANIAHLDNSNALMTPSISSGLRRLPSHTDLFSMASGHSYLNLDVPRREWYAGGSSWNTDGNWSGDTIPAGADVTFVRANGSAGIITAGLSANGNSADLFVGEAANVDTNAFLLTVNGTATVDGFDSDIIVDTGGELDADNVIVQNQAEFFMTGGLLDTGTMRIDSGTKLRKGAGAAATVDVATNLNNNGTIEAGGDDTLTFQSTGGAVWDLDGTGAAGIVDVRFGNINFATGSLTDAFDGDIDVGAGSVARTLTIAQPWSLGGGGIIDMSGGAVVADRAAIAGGTLTATVGDINANAGINQIQAAVVLGGSVDVVVADTATLEFTGAISNGGGDYTANGTGQMEFVGTTTYTGGTLNVLGLIQQNGDANVTGDTTINGERFDLDGDTGAGVDWTIGNANLVLNVDSIESAGAGGNFDGTITVNSSSIFSPAMLTINLTGGSEWTMAGTLNTNGPADPFLLTTIGAGTAFNLTGTANVDGNNGWSARVDVSGTINIVDAASTLRLTGGSIADPNRILGGSITGPGTLAATTNDALFGFGTISTDVSFLDDAELRADDGTLTVSGTLIDVGTIGTADTDGTLRVTNAWNTSVANQLELRGGTVTGAAITNGGITLGFGEITSTSFSNNNITSASGGTLTLDSTAFPDLDGATETGTINAVNGNISVPGNAGGAFPFDGTINVGAGRQFNMPLTPLTNSGTVNLTAGTIMVQGFSHEDTLNVNPGISTLTELGGGIAFQTGSTTTLNGDLNLVGDSLINAGATFAGPRRLFVTAGGTLRIANGANVGVGISNSGRTEVGASSGIALVNGYSQAAAGTYEAEIDGLLVGTQYDQLQVVNQANLAGTLDVLINQNGGAYADPVVAGSFHAFTLISAGSVSGDFDSVIYDGGVLVPEFGVGPTGDFVALDGCGLFRIMDYSASDVQLINYRALSGDGNGDGVVDGVDFGLWNANKLLAGTDWTTGDFNCDGGTDNLDFDIWNANKFTSVALPLIAGGQSLNSVPEPTAAGLILFLAVCGMRSRRPGVARTSGFPA